MNYESILPSLKKSFFTFLLFLASALCFGQAVEVIESHETRTVYEDKSYLLKKAASLTLAPNFHVSAATNGGFNVKVQTIAFFPQANSLAQHNTDITITFSDIMDMTTIGSGIYIHGSYSGVITGSWTQAGTKLVFDPSHDFFPGETVTVSITEQLLGTTGFWHPLATSHQFSISTQPALAVFSEGHIAASFHSPRMLAHADVDADGDVDIVAASPADKKITLFRNEGSGRFFMQRIAATNSWMYVAIADINGDGRLDVVGAAQDGNFKWFQQNEYGSYYERLISITITAISSMETSDVNGDGAIDIIIARGSNNDIFWIQNDGSGNFSASIHLITYSLDHIRSVKSADIDGDGDIDVVSASSGDNTISWFSNDGNGNFTMKPVISTSALGAESVAIADLDGDGDLDVLSASSGDNTIAWYKNNGTGSFVTMPPISTSAMSATDVASEDMDADGDMDVMSASSSDNRIVWYQNDGAGNFTVQPDVTDQALGAVYVGAADVDDDGSLDILSVSPLDHKIAWYPNVGAGSFPKQINVSGLADGAFSVASADLDNDGKLDVILGSFTDSQVYVYWYKNHGISLFSSYPITTYNEASTIYETEVSAADLDNDGYVDIVLRVASSIKWFRNDGMGVFGPESLIAYGFHSSVFADVNNDGFADAVLAKKSTSTEPHKVSVFLNDGTGNFSATSYLAMDGNVRSLSTGDLNGDGKIDIVAALDLYPGYIAILQNDGDGLFSLQAQIQSSYPKKVLIEDIDGDQNLDIVSGTHGYNAFSWFKNDGLGNFSNPTIVPSPEYFNRLHSISVSDIDGDGDGDVVSATDIKISSSGDYVGEYFISIYKNNGNAGFAFDSYLMDGELHPGVQAVDLTDTDGDGDIDVLATLQHSNEVRLYLNLNVLPQARQLTQNHPIDHAISSGNQFTISTPDISIYPNPASDHITIETADFADSSVEIYTLSGKRLKEPETLTGSKTEISLQAIEEHMVLLHVRRPGSIKTFKLLLTR